MYVSEVYDSPRVAVQVFTMSYIDNLLHYESFYFVVCKLFNTYTKYENIIHISLCFLLIVWEIQTTLSITIIDRRHGASAPLLRRAIDCRWRSNSIHDSLKSNGINC